MLAEGQASQRVALQRGDHRLELSGQPDVVRIEKDQVLAGRPANADISSRALPTVTLSDDPNPTAILLKNRGGGVGGTVVYNHDFVAFAVLRQGAVDCLGDRALRVVGRDYGRYLDQTTSSLVVNAP